MSEAEEERFMARVSHMANRIGMHPQRAEVLAYMLLVRDREGDDRRLCIECQHCAIGLHCTQWRQIGMSGPALGDMATMLQRCQGFRKGDTWA